MKSIFIRRNVSVGGNNLPFRIFLGFLSISGLILIYMTQQFNYLEFLTGRYHSPNFVFIFNRTLRFIFNDLLAILLIWSVFYERKYIMVAFFVQIIGLFLILPVYFILKLSFEGIDEISSPLLSFLHRIIINPIIILLLIPAFYYQKQKK